MHYTSTDSYFCRRKGKCGKTVISVHTRSIARALLPTYISRRLHIIFPHIYMLQNMFIFLPKLFKVLVTIYSKVVITNSKKGNVFKLDSLTNLNSFPKSV